MTNRTILALRNMTKEEQVVEALEVIEEVEDLEEVMDNLSTTTMDNRETT